VSTPWPQRRACVTSVIGDCPVFQGTSIGEPRQGVPTTRQTATASSLAVSRRTLAVVTNADSCEPHPHEHSESDTTGRRPPHPLEHHGRSVAYHRVARDHVGGMWRLLVIAELTNRLHKHRRHLDRQFLRHVAGREPDYVGDNAIRQQPLRRVLGSNTSRARPRDDSGHTCWLDRVFHRHDPSRRIPGAVSELCADRQRLASAEWLSLDWSLFKPARFGLFASKLEHRWHGYSDQAVGVTNE